MSVLSGGFELLLPVSNGGKCRFSKVIATKSKVSDATCFVCPVQPNLGEKGLKKLASALAISAFLARTYTYRPVFFLDFGARFGYHNVIVKIDYFVVLIDGTGDGKILLRKMDSIYA